MILLTGGSGLLGIEIKKLLPVYAPSHEEFDITNPVWPDMSNIELIIHTAAYTDVDGAEDNKELCYKTNVIGTKNLASNGIPILYISTNSVFDGEKGNYKETDIPNPINFYSVTKLIGENVLSPGSKIIRTSFRKSPWEYETAYEDRFTSAEYVDVIANKIAKAVNIFKSLPPIVHISGPRLSYYELAKQTRPDVLPGKFKELRARRHYDVSLDSSAWNSLQ